MNVQSVHGTYDITPEQALHWQQLRQIAAEIATKFGYKPIETPLIEQTELFERTIGQATDIVNKEMFTFQPRGEGSASITLRPEGTASICRAYLQSRLVEAPKPSRLYYIGPMFRYERPQKGRYRQFHQFGIEVIGDAAALADAEVIELAHAFLRAVMPQKQLRIVLNSFGTKQDRSLYLEKLRDYYAKYEKELPTEARERLKRSPLRMLDALPTTTQHSTDKNDESGIAMLYELSENAPRAIEHLGDEAKRHFDELCELLTSAEIEYEIDHKMVRGLDYYTHTVFEIGTDDFQTTRQATLIGGGRYDGLIELLGGQPTPAVGFAAGLDRILEDAELNLTETPPLLTVAYAEGYSTSAYKLTHKLRQQSKSKIVLAPKRSLKSQMRYANKSESQFVLIVGSKESAADKVVLKNLQQQDQQVELEMNHSKIIEAIRQ